MLNIQGGGGEIKQFYSPRQGKERRTIYRITIENEISPSTHRREYPTVHGRLLSFIAPRLFLRNEYVSCPEAITDGKEELSCGKPAQSTDTVHKAKGRTMGGGDGEFVCKISNKIVNITRVDS